MLGSFSAWFWNLLVLQRHGVSLPGGDFVEAVLLLAAAGNRICRKTVFFWDFRRSVREFFGVVLELARPSEAWCFEAVLPGGGATAVFWQIQEQPANTGPAAAAVAAAGAFGAAAAAAAAADAAAGGLATAAGNRICRKILFFLGLQTTR